MSDQETYRTCRFCKFYDTSASLGDNPYSGQCRGSTPGHDDRTGKAVWPMTEDYDWCGEFSENPSVIAEYEKSKDIGDDIPF